MSNVNMDNVNKLMNMEGVDEHFLFHLKAIKDADCDMDKAFENIKGKTPYRTAFLFKKSMTSRIEKALNGQMPKAASLESKKAEKKADNKESKDEYEPTIQYCIDNEPDKNIKKILQIVQENGIKNFEELCDASRETLKSFKGLGDKKIDALEEWEEYHKTM